MPDASFLGTAYSEMRHLAVGTRVKPELCGFIW